MLSGKLAEPFLLILGILLIPKLMVIAIILFGAGFGLAKLKARSTTNRIEILGEEDLSKDNLIQEWVLKKKELLYWRWVNKSDDIIEVQKSDGEVIEGKVFYKEDQLQPRVSQFRGWDKNDCPIVLGGTKLFTTKQDLLVKNFVIELEDRLGVFDPIMEKTIKNGTSAVKIKKIIERELPAKREKNALAKAALQVGGFASAKAQDDSIIFSMEDGSPVQTKETEPAITITE